MQIKYFYILILPYNEIIKETHENLNKPVDFNKRREFINTKRIYP